ncbi:MAG: cobalt-precorrin-5B (C(1))-methyltransferase CbiD [Lachnospiraceae bacterium]|nr:cobalt-precorrin-5B (C(1))-methyltransferase CbiD [Lachnospiraceae bacterium]
MRHGFTTGSCAAAASAAAAYMLLTGREMKEILIDTPKGVPFTAEILEVTRGEKSVKCAVRKDAGDDPDITNGSLVFSEVTVVEGGARWEHAEEVPSGASNEGKGASSPKPYQDSDVEIRIDGGEGVGRVTMPGLDQPMGNAAINSVPRRMIREEVLKICEFTDFHGVLSCLISIPAGVNLAKKTFNPKLGIVGGISVLGTSGVVEPMSMRALLETIRVELNVRKAGGYENVIVAPGNYGRDFLKREYGYDIDKSVKCSNFIGDAIDMAADLGFQKMLLVGHIGKLIKVSGGVMNTHSREGDCRMELLAASALLAGADGDTARSLLSCVTTEDGITILNEAGLTERTMEIVFEKVMAALEKRADERIEMECILYSNVFGVLAKSPGAEDMLRENTLD